MLLSQTALHTCSLHHQPGVSSQQRGPCFVPHGQGVISGHQWILTECLVQSSPRPAPFRASCGAVSLTPVSAGLALCRDVEISDSSRCLLPACLLLPAVDWLRRQLLAPHNWLGEKPQRRQSSYPVTQAPARRSQGAGSCCTLEPGLSPQRLLQRASARGPPEALGSSPKVPVMLLE